MPMSNAIRSDVQPASAAGPAGRQRILDVAAALFLERGYLGTSLREIASEVGMKPGSLYYHFASKDALLEAILRQGIGVMVEAFRAAAVATQGADGCARFGAHVRAHLAALFENGPYTAAHVTTFRTAPPAVCDAIVPERDAYESMWSELLRELKANNEIAPETPISLSRLALFGAMNSAIEWFDPTRGSLDTFAEAITGQFWSGLSRSSNEEDA
jgi:AcrR family transcriptional regulator